jgi:type IV pilus assembly protein PilY1
MASSNVRTRKFGWVALGVLGFVARDAAAQTVDVNPPLPNTLILLDNSGSMEKMIDGTDPESSNATCSPGVQTAPNRWGAAVQALTGDIAPYYSCYAMPRTRNSEFDLEYRINGKVPYDIDYFLKFHRPASGSSAATACLVAPGYLPGSPVGQGVGTPPKGAGGLATDFPGNAISTRLASGAAGSCTFNQFSNGVLDSARDMVRFGLMTYDQDPAEGVGVGSTMSVGDTPLSPFDGQWSYYPGWKNGSGGLSGKPADCTVASLFELGARNPAAPPWEGRLMQFPSSTATIAQVQAQNDRIQLAINALRPYGATPTAALFEDAKYYLWSDPDGPQQTDSYVQGDCRDEYVIFISDGAPNQDLRPACASAPIDPQKPGVCPYRLPEDTAAELATGGANKHKVKTFVIGFAVSSVQDGNTLVQCSSLVNNATLSSVCSDPSKQATYGACCTLQKIALAGGTGNAYFADTAGDLNKALGAIIANIAKNVTTRTLPAYSPVVSNPSVNPNAKVTNAAMFLSSFAPIPGKPWVGTVQRQRYQCTFNNNAYTVPPPVVDPTEGDDFAANLNLPGTQSKRSFRSVLADAVSSVPQSSATLRPSISASLPGVHGDDKLGTLGGTLVGSNASALKSSLTPAALNINGTSCPNSTNTQYLTAASCRNLALNFTLGEPSTDAMPDFTFSPFAARTGFVMGDIYHSTPAVVGPPSANLADESYRTFASLTATRKTVLYTATNDGLLHAFDTDVTKNNREDGELWSFLPPAVLPKLLSSYPGSHQLLLDGAPIVKDVVFDRSKAANSLLLASNWHTALVAGFGSGNRGYYALDVTDPSPSSDLTKGPKFLWQLTDMPNYQSQPQRQLFGQHGATPAITTIFADLDGTGAHEIGVAILPGGSDGPPTGAACDRMGTVGQDAAPSGYPRRNKVRCWAASGQPVAGRSVTVVRLDTGEVLRVFGRQADLPQALIDADRVGAVETPLDSPMTGIPVVYPSTPGSVAQKAFIGDEDGTIWRFDFTSTNPKDWKGELFYDAYNTTLDNAATNWNDGQPIPIPPVIALNRNGGLVVAIATGDQETYTPSGKNFVASLTEKSNGTKLVADLNWYVPFTNGERVSGPMTIFDSTLYFSTYAPPSNAGVCAGGTAKMWGHDFVLPQDTTDLSLGGKYRLQPPSNPPPSPPQYIVPATYDPTLAGKLIPGVSVNVTPACADTSGSINDQYTGGAHTIANYVTPGNYQLVAQVGGKNQSNSGASNATFTVALPAPRNVSIVDSWASIVE